MKNDVEKNYFELALKEMPEEQKNANKINIGCGANYKKREMYRCVFE